MRDFFISYTSVDVKWAVWVAWVLEEAGYTVFIQAWDILPGNNFVAEMQSAMTGTRKTIAILSEDYFKSGYTKAEWTVAITHDPAGENRILVPVKVRPCETEGFFATIFYIDIVGRSEQDARASLLGAFSSRLNPDRFKPEVPPAFPGAESEQRVVESPAMFPGDIGHTAGNITDKIIDTSATDNIMTAPLRQHLASATKPALTAEERLRLRKNLDRLSLSQFNMLVFALGPPPDAIPSLPAPQEQRIDTLLRWAEGPSGRGLGEVRSVFEEMLRPPDGAPAELANAHRGVDVVKTCDRKKQEEDFNTFFKLCNDRRRGHAQFYFIQGREMQGHKSLVERFCGTTIREHAGGVRLKAWEPGWPQTGNLRVDSERLVSLLFEEAGHDDVSGTLNVRARAFRDAASALPPVVVLLHKIEARDWLRTTRRLIHSYIEFWDEVKRADVEGHLPLFLVFFCFVHPVFQDRSRLPLRQMRLLRHRLMVARVKLGLWRLAKMRGRSPLAADAQQNASVALLKELTCVSLKDVKDWLERHRYGDYDAQWVEESQNIFIENRWELFECKNMADVEWALSKFVTKMTPTNSAYI